MNAPQKLVTLLNDVVESQLQHGPQNRAAAEKYLPRIRRWMADEGLSVKPSAPRSRGKLQSR